MPSTEDPIGIFDSGVGGLTIMKEIVRHLPAENVIYFGDAARLPYGDKSAEAIFRYTLESASFLLQQKIKFLILACFTASSYALEVLEQTLSIPVIGVIQSGFEALMNTTISRRVAILGTASTVKSGIIQTLIQRWDTKAVVFPVACSLLAPMIEKGLSAHPATRFIVKQYLKHLKKEHIDSALLACTHYPLIQDLIQDVLGSTVRLIQPARLCALKTKDRLKSCGLLNETQKKPIYKFYVTENAEKFCRLTKGLSNNKMKHFILQ